MTEQKSTLSLMTPQQTDIMDKLGDLFAYAAQPGLTPGSAINMGTVLPLSDGKTVHFSAIVSGGEHDLAYGFTASASGDSKLHVVPANAEFASVHADTPEGYNLDDIESTGYRWINDVLLSYAQDSIIIESDPMHRIAIRAPKPIVC